MDEAIHGTCGEVRCPCHSKLAKAEERLALMEKVVEAARRHYRLAKEVSMRRQNTEQDIVELNKAEMELLGALDAVSTGTGEKGMCGV